MAKKPASNNSAKMWVKIVCGFLGFMMIFGVLIMFISSLQSAAVENSSLPTTPDQQISIGLYCNENAVQSYALQAENGVQISSQSGLSVLLDAPDVIIGVDDNLYRKDGSFSTESGGIATVGGYHIEISYFTFSDLGIDTDHDNPVFIRPGDTTGSTDGYSPANVYEYIDLLSKDNTYKALNLTAFPYYVSAQKCYIRVGNFFTQKEAEDVLAQLRRTITMNADIATPDSDTVTVLASDWNILCELDNAKQGYQITARNNGVLREESGRAFYGNISIARADSSSYKCISVLNKLSLETYVSALLPTEASSDWEIELLKTVAVVLRTEVVRNLGSHVADGYDLCDSGHCHSYIGSAPITERVLQAVNETAGQILTYEDRPIFAPYSMENGSGTISAKDAFGKDVPYLPAIYTPWEESSEWTVEFTPFELYQLLNAGGYTEITSNIFEVKVLSTASGSDYVNAIQFTDLFGTSVTIEGSEVIRIFFAGRIPSTCFVVGKAGDKVSRKVRTLDDGSYVESEETILLEGTYGSFVFCGSGSGCGVGISMLGARALAKQGIDYQEILSRYFPGTVLSVPEQE